jgi:hypothetical protein
MFSPHRFFFQEPGRPSAGDKLLDAADGLKIELWHHPDFKPALCCKVELRSAIPLCDDDAADGFALLADLLATFRRLGEKGGEGHVE